LTHDVWSSGDPYEAYVGRWSRRVAPLFLAWLGVAAGRRWLDVGCGTGALTATVLGAASPQRVVAVDPSEGFLATARAKVTDPLVEFRVGDARQLPVADASVDAVVSGLALNFVPEPAAAVAEFARVAVPGGVVAAYVWDYAEGMVMMRYFWEAAASVDPGSAALDEGDRFPICRPEALADLWSGFGDVSVDAIEIPTVFADFDDYWTPFLGGQGAAPGYLMSRPVEERDAVRELLRSRLPAEADGSIPLTARAWAVRGITPL